MQPWNHMCPAPLHKHIFTHFSFLSQHCTNFHMNVCKGLENVGRRKNIDFLFEWKDEVPSR